MHGILMFFALIAAVIPMEKNFKKIIFNFENKAGLFFSAQQKIV